MLNLDAKRQESKAKEKTKAIQMQRKMHVQKSKNSGILSANWIVVGRTLAHIGSTAEVRPAVRRLWTAEEMLLPQAKRPLWL